DGAVSGYSEHIGGGAVLRGRGEGPRFERGPRALEGDVEDPEGATFVPDRHRRSVLADPHAAAGVDIAARVLHAPSGADLEEDGTSRADADDDASLLGERDRFELPRRTPRVATEDALELEGPCAEEPSALFRELRLLGRGGAR